MRACHRKPGHNIKSVISLCSPICKCLHISVFFYLKKFKSSKPDAQVIWVEFFHNAEQVIIMLFIMHRHQVHQGLWSYSWTGYEQRRTFNDYKLHRFFSHCIDKKTYLGVSEVERSFEVFDTDTAQFVPVSEAVHITRFRHRKPRSDICMACNKP